MEDPCTFFRPALATVAPQRCNRFQRLHQHFQQLQLHRAKTPDPEPSVELKTLHHLAHADDDVGQRRVTMMLDMPPQPVNLPVLAAKPFPSKKQLLAQVFSQQARYPCTVTHKAVLPYPCHYQDSDRSTSPFIHPSPRSPVSRTALSFILNRIFLYPEPHPPTLETVDADEQGGTARDEVPTPNPPNPEH